MSGFLIGLDLGTSFVKASLFDFNGNELASACEPLSIISPFPGWFEQNPLEWVKAVQKALRSIIRSIDPNEVQAIGLCAQCPGHVLLDQRYQPVENAIIWSDGRAIKEAEWFGSKTNRQERIAWVGSGYIDNPFYSPARLLWLKNHHNSFSEISFVLQPKDYIGFILTGRIATDNFTAFLLAHPETGQYHPDLLNILNLKREQLPPVVAPTDKLGIISKSGAGLSGLAQGTPVFVGTIDAYCDTLAGGAIIPGQGVNVSGTSEIISLGVKRKIDGQGVFSVGIGSNDYFLCAPLQTGASVLKWLAKSMYPETAPYSIFSKLESEASQVKAGAGGLLFLPYLQGARAPHWDSKIRGAFIGIDQSHDRRSFALAVYEGVGFAIRHVMEICEEVGGITADRIVICGGAAGSQFWNRIKANILQKNFIPLEIKNSACLGASIIAAVGLSAYSDFSTAWKKMRRLGDPILPDQCLSDLYDESYHSFRRAYPGVKSFFI